MCGIAGVVCSPLNAVERMDVVERMMKLIAHRGPDGDGYFEDDCSTFGHKRLAIIDIENGSQPMISEDGRWVLVYNGEIYNYIELRQRLIQRGIRFRTFSDTEVLLNLLISEGEAALTQLNGMFAFAFYDSQTGNFLLCRDRLGIKPLYYCQKKEGLFFASEIKALVKSGVADARLNKAALYDYLTYQFCLGESTLFEGIRKINPGHFIRGGRNREIQEIKYWDTNYSIDQYHNEDYFQEQLINLLHDSVKIQMRSDVPVGVYLSGGVDSSAIAMLAHAHAPEGLAVFHGKFSEGLAFDESRYAEKIAREISAAWHEVIPSQTDFIREFQNLIYYLDEPVAGPGSFPQLLVSKLASKNVKVVLGGQGGDELFCGYARYLIGYLEQSLKGGIFETQEEGKHIVQLATIIKSLPLLKEYVPLMKSFWQDGLFGEMDERYFRLIDRSPNLDRVLHRDLINSYNRNEVFSGFQKIFNHPDTSSYINKMTHFDLKTLLPALLQVEDRMSMAASLESRVPLLDHRIVDFVTSMPPATKFNAGQTKYIFKKALKNIVPGEVLNRKDKMGFPVPINVWLTTPSFKSFVSDLLLSKASRERGIFDPGEVERMIHTEQGFSRQLWGALSLEVWFQTFIDK